MYAAVPLGAQPEDLAALLLGLAADRALQGGDPALLAQVTKQFLMYMICTAYAPLVFQVDARCAAIMMWRDCHATATCWPKGLPAPIPSASQATLPLLRVCPPMCIELCCAGKCDEDRFGNKKFQNMFSGA